MNVSELQDYFANAEPEIKVFLASDELEKSVAVLGESHGLQISKYLALQNVVTLLLIGALKPEGAVDSLKEHLEITDSAAYLLAKDIDASILQKVRMSIFGKTEGEIKEIKLGNPDEKRESLRAQIAQEINKNPTPPEKDDSRKVPTMSRNDLMEQLGLLEKIPNDEDVEKRMAIIKDQLEKIKKEEEVQEKEQEKEILLKPKEIVVTAEPKMAPYSEAPTHYNVDPYKETVE